VTTIVNTVTDPSGIVLGPDGSLYVSANSTATNGQILRLQP
jgi:glucose/arabinose dehydrogenase